MSAREPQPDRRTARRGPAPSMTVPQIVEVAIALADRSGLAGVTMRAVASALGTSAPGLYRYIASREELLSAMVDHVSGQVAHPQPSGDWLADLLDVAGQQLALYRSHPWLAHTAPQSLVLGPRALDHLDRCLAILEPVDASVSAKLEAIAMTTAAASLFAGAGTAPDASMFAHLDPDRHPRLTRIFTSADPRPAAPDLFERAVTGLLLGVLEQR